MIVRVLVRRNNAAQQNGAEDVLNSKEKPEPGFSTYTHRTTAATESHSQSQMVKKVEISLEKDTFSLFLMKCDEALGSKEGEEARRAFDSKGTPIYTIHELV
jgi:hypothetical protein